MSIQEQTNDTAAAETREKRYVWEHSMLEGAGDDVDRCIAEMLVEGTLEAVNWRRNEDIPGVLWDMAHLAVPMVAYLVERSEDIAKSRGARLNAIYREALAMARERVQEEYGGEAA